MFVPNIPGRPALVLLVTFVLAFSLTFKQCRLMREIVDLASSPSQLAPLTPSDKSALSPRSASLGDGHDIKLLSYNIFCRPWPLCHGHAGDFLGARLPCLVDALGSSPYDVLCLQELWSASVLPFDHRPRFVKELVSKHGFRHVVLPRKVPLANKKLCESGLVIFSRPPIAKSDNIVFKAGIGSDGWTEKGALYALVQLARARDVGDRAGSGHSFLHVFNTHLQAGDASRATAEANSARAVRKQQLRELRSFITVTTSGDTFPIIICGDFNVDSMCEPVATEYADMLEIFGPGFAPCSGEGSATTTWFLHSRAGTQFNDLVPEVCPVCQKEAEKMYSAGRLRMVGNRVDHAFINTASAGRREGNQRECLSAETDVVKFPVNRSEAEDNKRKRDNVIPSGYLSDHFAVEVTLKLW